MFDACGLMLRRNGFSVASRQQLVGPASARPHEASRAGGLPPLCAEARKRRPGGLAPAWDPRWWSQVTSQHTDPSYRHSMHHSEGARDAGRGPKWVRHKPRKAASGTSHACATGQNHQLLQRTPPVVIVPPYLTPLRKASGEGVPEKVQIGRRSGLLGSNPGL